jgi:hypothetical protein
MLLFFIVGNMWRGLWDTSSVSAGVFGCMQERGWSCFKVEGASTWSIVRCWVSRSSVPSYSFGMILCCVLLWGWPCWDFFIRLRNCLLTCVCGRVIESFCYYLSFICMYTSRHKLFWYKTMSMILTVLHFSSTLSLISYSSYSYSTPLKFEILHSFCLSPFTMVAHNYGFWVLTMHFVFIISLV